MHQTTTGTIAQPTTRRLPRSVEELRGEVVGVGTLASLLDGTERPYVFLDNAASTPAFRYVLDPATGAYHAREFQPDYQKYFAFERPAHAPVSRAASEAS